MQCIPCLSYNKLQGECILQSPIFLPLGEEKVFVSVINVNQYCFLQSINDNIHH